MDWLDPAYQAIYLFGLWIIFACFEGFREAFYFYYKYNKGMYIKINIKTIDEHLWFTASRLVVFMGLFVGFANIDYWFCFLFCPLVFPYFHDGTYYATYNTLSPTTYVKRWKDHSTTSTAMSTKYLTYPVRVSLFIAGLIFFIIDIILKH